MCARLEIRTGRLAHTRAVRAKCSLAGLTKGGAQLRAEKGDHIICQTLPGLPRAARPSGRFAEGKTPQRIYFGLKRIRKYFGLNMRQHIVGTVDNLLARALNALSIRPRADAHRPSFITRPKNN